MSKLCDKCSQPFKGFGTTCSKCRKAGGKGGGVPHDCDRCGNFFIGSGSVCSDCLTGKGPGRTGIKLPTPDEVDAVLDKIGVCIMKVDTSQTSMVKLRQAEFNLLSQLEVVRDLMERIYKSGDRLLLQSTFIDCGRMSRLSAFLSQIHLSEMNAKDSRLPACRQTCAKLREKVEADLEIGDQLQDFEQIAAQDLLKARLSIVMDPEKVADLQVDMFSDNLFKLNGMKDKPDPLAKGEDGFEWQEDDTDPYDYDFESDEEEVTQDESDERFKEQVRQLFDELDRNGDGNLTREEVRNSAFGLSDMLKKCKIHKRSQVVKMFKQGDLDGNGELDFDEFLAYILAARKRAIDAMPKPIDDAMVRMVFATMDKDGDGEITCEELKFAYAGILLRAGEPVDPKRVNKWAKRNFKKYDTDGSQALDIDEFKKLLANCGGLKQLLTDVKGFS